MKLSRMVPVRMKTVGTRLKTIARGLVLVAVLAAVAVVSSSPAGLAEAQSGQTWVSSVTVQNQGSGNATVQLLFYPTGGGSPITVNLPTIQPGKSYEQFIGNNVPSGVQNGQYSIVVQSNQPVVAMANLSSSNPFYNGSYRGLNESDTATRMSVPGLKRDYYNWDSTMVVQNAGSLSANVRITYYKVPGTGTKVVNDTINAGASKSYDLATITDLGTRYNGSAIVESTNNQKLAVIVNNRSRYLDGQLQSFNGFNPANVGSKAYVPQLTHNYYGWISSLDIQNVGDVATTITVKYSNPAIADDVFTNVAPGDSRSIYYGQAKYPSGNSNGRFAATVSASSSSHKIVAIANAARDIVPAKSSSYSGFADGSTTIDIPSLFNNYYNWYASMNIQNVDTAAANITVTYSYGGSDTFTNVAPGASREIFYGQAKYPSGNTNGKFSATVTSPNGKKLVAIVNQEVINIGNLGPGDWHQIYEGFNR